MRNPGSSSILVVMLVLLHFAAPVAAFAHAPGAGEGSEQPGGNGEYEETRDGVEESAALHDTAPARPTGHHGAFFEPDRPSHADYAASIDRPPANR